MSAFLDSRASVSDGNVRRAMPTAPDGDRTGLIDSSVFLRDDEDVSAVCQEMLGERLDSRIVERVLFERRAFDRYARFVRLEQEMRTVEQQLAFESVCRGFASKLAIAFDAGV